MLNDNQSSSIPLADVLRMGNDLVAAGLIEDWAFGGALAAIYYVIRPRQNFAGKHPATA